MAYIYQITNDINGKIYIGKTERSIAERFNEHCRDRLNEGRKDRPLYRAMNKYGVEHFHIEMLEETDCPEEREIYWIEQKQSFKNGYNATVGGDGKKYLDYDLIRSVYEITENASETARQLNISVDSVYTAVRQCRKLKPCSEISKEKLGKVVHMYSKNNEYLQTFASLKEAGAYLIDNGFTASHDLRGVVVHIREVANEKRKTAYGFVWKWAVKI